MADTRIPYTPDTIYGEKLASATGDFFKAKDSLHRIRDMITPIGDDPDVEAAMELPTGQYYAYNMKLILDAVLVDLDANAADMSRMDKGL